MRVIRVTDHAEVSALAAELLAKFIAEHDEVVLALPTGGTPLGMYNELVTLARTGALDLGRATVFNLDEYVGLPSDHSQSYASYMRRHLYDRAEFDPTKLHIPDGNAEDLVAACASYEGRIAEAGGLDIAVLGIGANGHIAFNEPGCGLNSRVRVVRLSDRTVLDNARFFDDPRAVPRHAITMGVGTIRSSRALMMLASGEGKAAAVAAALEGPVTTRCPASAIQLHPSAVVILDEEAASALRVRPWSKEEFLADPYAPQFLFL